MECSAGRFGWILSQPGGRRSQEAVALCIVLVLSLSCHRPGPAVGATAQQYRSIQTMLDRAVVAADPVRSLAAAIPRVRAYSVVDSVWMQGNELYVHFRNGGTASWEPGRSHQQNQGGNGR